MGYSLVDKDGKVNYRRYANTLDYSLDQIKLREVYEKVYRRTNFSFYGRKKEYTSRVINVTFKYSVAEFNKAGKNRYIRFGYKDADLSFDDCVAIKDGELVGIILDNLVECPVSDEVLGRYFGFEDGKYTLIKTPKTIKSTAELRRILYNDGFVCNGIRYVRWKRSSGSSRVGKCLFIDEKLYARMHKWEMCGLKVADGEEVDLAALESYISLPSSSIIDILEINPENILIIDDYESKFYDRVMSVGEDGDHLVAEEKDEQISNSIWDGQGLIDVSAIEDEFDISPAESKNDVVYKLLGLNDRFAQTKLYHDFKIDILKSFTKNLRLGHVLVEGNYETLFGNPIEMLQASIGKFDGASVLGVGNIHTKRFGYGQRLVGSRSPHISMSNVWVPTNVECSEIDRYFNLTNEIVCINSIGENVLNELSGCDR